MKEGRIRKKKKNYFFESCDKKILEALNNWILLSPTNKTDESIQNKKKKNNTKQNKQNFFLFLYHFLQFFVIEKIYES